MGEEERTGPMWYRSWTKSEEPSNFLDEERLLGGSFGLMYSGLVFKVCNCGGFEEVEA